MEIPRSEIGTVSVFVSLNARRLGFAATCRKTKVRRAPEAGSYFRSEYEERAPRFRLADEYDAAQERGEVATKGKPVNVPGENIKATAAARDGEE